MEFAKIKIFANTPRREQVFLVILVMRRRWPWVESRHKIFESDHIDTGNELHSAVGMADDPPFPNLETPRLILREILPSDVEIIFAIHGNPDLMKWFGVDPLPDIEAAQKVIEAFAAWRRHPTPGTRWGIQLKKGGALVGTCGLFQWNAMWRKCVVGYELNHAAHGKGFAREALVACFNWAFTTSQLHRIEAQVHPDNFPSIKLLERIGFVKEGVLREVGYWGGMHHSMLQYGMLREEFKASN